MNDTTTYTIRVDGHLDLHWSPRLADLAITHHRDGTSSLTGLIADQAQLHGVLASLRDIGAVLIDLHAIGSEVEPAQDPANPQRPTVPASPQERNSR